MVATYFGLSSITGNLRGGSTYSEVEDLPTTSALGRRVSHGDGDQTWSLFIQVYMSIL